MTVVHNASTSGSLDHLPVPCDGVSLSSHAQGGATVIAATGEIDASNIHRLTEYAQQHVGQCGSCVVVDLTQLEFLGAQGVPALFDIDSRCGQGGVQWALVPSRAVSRLLRICDTESRLPAVSSVDEALASFSRPNGARPLLKLVTETG